MARDECKDKCEDECGDNCERKCKDKCKRLMWRQLRMVRVLKFFKTLEFRGENRVVLQLHCWPDSRNKIFPCTFFFEYGPL